MSNALEVQLGEQQGSQLRHLVSQKAEMNIKLEAYYLRYSEKISQVFQPTDLTVQTIHTISDLHDSDGNWNDPKAPIINERDWSKTFDGMDEFFRKCYGITSIPLPYIIRKDTTPKEGEETDWDDPLEQMIERAPHTITEPNGTIIKHPTFVTHNKMLFDKLSESTRDNECWSYIKPHARARNGRAAYMAFKNHYLGPNNIGNMAATAEHKLIDATYREEGRHWDFENMPHYTRNNIPFLRD